MEARGADSMSIIKWLKTPKPPNSHIINAIAEPDIVFMQTRVALNCGDSGLCIQKMHKFAQKHRKMHLTQLRTREIIENFDLEEPPRVSHELYNMV